MRQRNVILLDVDGVVLAAPSLKIAEYGEISFPDGMTTPEESRAALIEAWGDVAEYTHRDIGAPRLYSPSAIAALNALVGEFDLEVVYHSTWLVWPTLLDDLISTLRLPAGAKLNAGGYDEYSWSHVKKSVIRDFLELIDTEQDEPAHVVVIDDHAYEWAEWVHGGAWDRRLVLHPATHRGITPLTIQRARTFFAGAPDGE